MNNLSLSDFLRVREEYIVAFRAQVLAEEGVLPSAAVEGRLSVGDLDRYLEGIRELRRELRSARSYRVLAFCVELISAITIGFIADYLINPSRYSLEPLEGSAAKAMAISLLILCTLGVLAAEYRARRPVRDAEDYRDAYESVRQRAALERRQEGLRGAVLELDPPQE